MIDPVLHLDARVVLFPLRQDLTPDWAALDACMSGGDGVTALLLPHYFGFPQPIDTVRAWCKRHQVAYVEDCSHALFGEYHGKPIGSFGDRAIASPYKFFASENGGLVRGIAPDASLPRPTSSLREELKAIWRSLEKWALYRRKRLHHSGVEEAGFPCGTDTIKEDARISRQYDPAVEHVQALRWSRLTLRLSSVDRLSAARRRNYQAWLDAIADMPGCRPLFETLPVGVVPYMFPLWLDDAERVFFRLKRAGLPIFRWDELAVSDCEVSGRARLNLIHLPCHQGIGEREMGWMVEGLRRSLR